MNKKLLEKVKYFLLTTKEDHSSFKRYQEIKKELESIECFYVKQGNEIVEKIALKEKK